MMAAEENRGHNFRQSGLSKRLRFLIHRFFLSVAAGRVEGCSFRKGTGETEVSRNIKKSFLI